MRPRLALHRGQIGGEGTAFFVPNPKQSACADPGTIQETVLSPQDSAPQAETVKACMDLEGK